jgi:hypothetical protein
MTNDQRTRLAHGLAAAGERLQHAGDALVELGLLFSELETPAAGAAPPSRPKLATPPPVEHDDEPANVNADPCPLKKGGALYGWAKDHNLVNRINLIGQSRQYPERMVDWDSDQVADVYHEIVSKSPPGKYPVSSGPAQHSRKAVR